MKIINFPIYRILSGIIIQIFFLYTVSFKGCVLIPKKSIDKKVPMSMFLTKILK